MVKNGMKNGKLNNINLLNKFKNFEEANKNIYLNKLHNYDFCKTDENAEDFHFTKAWV